MKLAVIGGGAAGMFCAIFAAQNGAEVTLYEKNEKLGKKIYITGKGRCNVTNMCDQRTFLSNVVTNSKFLFSSAYKWSSADTFDFFSDAGLQMKVERGNRVFPESDKASDVTKILQRKLERNNVEIRLNSPIKSISIAENGFFLSTISDIVFYDRVVICCGGVSYPTTGSSGDGYKLARQLGHTIVDPKPALCEIIVQDDVSQLEGLSLKNVKLSAVSHDSKILFSSDEVGEMLFTKNGLSGPLALTCSSYINTASSAILSIDLKPALTNELLDQRLLRDFSEFQNKEFKNSLDLLLPKRLTTYIVSRSNIPEWQKVHQITAQQRSMLVSLLKNLTFELKQLGNIQQAIITSGGVNVNEVEPSTMQSKIHKGLYFCGEVLDVDALTGGFNMQIAFSTGYLAGISASKELL